MVVRSQKALLWLALLIADSSAFVPAVSRRSHLALYLKKKKSKRVKKKQAAKQAPAPDAGRHTGRHTAARHV